MPTERAGDEGDTAEVDAGVAQRKHRGEEDADT